jgi:hypothetical protein
MRDYKSAGRYPTAHTRKFRNICPIDCSGGLENIFEHEIVYFSFFADIYSNRLTMNRAGHRYNQYYQWKHKKIPHVWRKAGNNRVWTWPHDHLSMCLHQLNQNFNRRRDTVCRIHIADQRISRQHAEISAVSQLSPTQPGIWVSLKLLGLRAIRVKDENRFVTVLTKDNPLHTVRSRYIYDSIFRVECMSGFEEVSLKPILSLSPTSPSQMCV